MSASRPPQGQPTFGRALADFLARETTAAFLLFLAAAAAMIAVNSALSDSYLALWQAPVDVRVGPLEVAKPLQLWVNDGLMAIFFFVVGMEMKREILEGQLSSLDKCVLPACAAVGGIALPALVFVAVNWNAPQNLGAWAIPAATDIAFALGVLALLGSRVPPALKILLLAIAIIDDVGAIAIIAVFYTADVSLPALGFAVIAGAGLLALNLLGVTRLWLYGLLAVVLWLCVLKSGVHATLAGVVAALAIPLRSRRGPSPLKALEHALHPWIAFAILPIFAFANAGVSLDGFGLSSLLAPLPAGIALGLIVGKQAGVLGCMALAIRSGLAKRPPDVSWRQLYGLACLTGVGFTMSLFIGTLAFDDAPSIEAMKAGVIVGSLVSGLVGVLVLRPAAR